jgi:energy-coupling factor transport system substrate-specific component
MTNSRRNFSTLVLALIPVAIAINIAIGQLVYGVLKIPFLYLDSIGTVLVGLLGGPFAGLITGALSNLIWGLLGNASYVPFFYVAAVIGLLAGIFARLGWARKIWMWGLGGLITGVVAAVLSAPTSAIVFGGVTGAGTDLLVAAFRASGANIMQATFGQGIVSDPFDKLITFLVVFLIVLALPKRTRARFPNGEYLPGTEHSPQPGKQA